jgi:hypothetical protein
MSAIGEKGDTSMRTVYRLADEGLTFSTRPRGAELRERLLTRAHDADAVELDLDGVLSVSYSFADEFVGPMRDREVLGNLPFELVIRGASPEVTRVIERVEKKRADYLAAAADPPCFA